MKKFVSLLITLVIVLALFPINTKVEAAALYSRKFDFGGNGVASGYTGVSASDKYNTTNKYGFTDTSKVENESAGGTGALSDAVRFKKSTPFNVDLPKGVYKITVTTGNADSVTITAEGYNQLFFLTGNNATDSFTIPVTDGQLNISAGAGAGTKFSISTLEIEQTSTETTTKPTIWICGDESGACVYNITPDDAHGWGQYLGKYIDTNKYDIRNISASGVSAGEIGQVLLPTVEAYGKKGDILILTSGINDYVDETVLHPNSISSSTYEKDLTDVVRRAKKKDMTIYLVKQHGEEDDHFEYPLPEEKWFSTTIDKIAKSENVKVLDLFSPWLEMLLLNYYYYNEDYYVKGVLLNEKGADKMAQMAADILFPKAEPAAPGNPYVFDETPSVIYETEVSGGIIANPHKGFVMTAHNPYMMSDKFDYGINGPFNNQAWNLCTIVSGSPKWCNLNPAEDIYNWDEIDEMLEECEKRGFTYGIRIMPYSSYHNEDYVPQWIYDKGAKKYSAKLKDKPTEVVEFPKWDDPKYLDACKKFAKALAEKYDGDPRVEFIDVRPFGDYGEWHNSFVEGEFMPSLEIQKDMLDCYANAFKKSVLVLPSNARGEIYQYALSLGITKRDDGLISLGNAEWSLVPTYEANMPVIGENYWPYAWMRDTVRETKFSLVNWTPERFRETIEISHLSIFALDQDGHCSYEFYNEQKDVIDEMCNKLGYNFTVTAASRYNNELVVSIKNTGLASCFFNIQLAAEITDENGKKISDFGTPILIEKGTFHDGDEKYFLFEYNGTLDKNATICLAMYDIDNPLVQGKDPTVKFDNKNNLSNNRLKLVPSWTASEGTPANNPTGAPTNKPTGTPSNNPTGTPTNKPASVPGSSVTEQDPKQQILDFVSRLYKYVLNRDPEQGGLEFWTDELYTFKQSGAGVAQGFIFSKEFIDRKTSDEEFVTILYKTFFGREPDDAGFNFWVSSLKDGSNDRQAVANGFIYSLEWANTCAEYGIRSGGTTKPSVKIAPGDLTYAFVERMYTTALKRESDPDGKEFWANELSNFISTGESVGVSFFLSPEMESMNLSNEEFVTRLYKTFMDRDPETEGFNFWVKFLNDGNSREAAVYGFTRSEEFLNKCIEARILPY